MARCDDCMKNPVHPDKQCCFNCARSGTNCEVWHNCGEDCPGWESKVVTNADKIRAMSDEELAALICKHKPMCSWPKGVQKIFYSTRMTGVEAWMHWLQQPAEDDC